MKKATVERELWDIKTVKLIDKEIGILIQALETVRLSAMSRAYDQDAMAEYINDFIRNIEVTPRGINYE